MTHDISYVNNCRLEYWPVCIGITICALMKLVFPIQPSQQLITYCTSPYPNILVAIKLKELNCSRAFLLPRLFGNCNTRPNHNRSWCISLPISYPLPISYHILPCRQVASKCHPVPSHSHEQTITSN